MGVFVTWWRLCFKTYGNQLLVLLQWLPWFSSKRKERICSLQSFFYVRHIYIYIYIYTFQSPAVWIYSIVKWLHSIPLHKCTILHLIPSDEIKNLPAMQETQETQVQSLGGEDPLEEDMATHSSILAWKIIWIEEPGSLQSMRWQRIRHNWALMHSSEWMKDYCFHFGGKNKCDIKKKNLLHDYIVCTAYSMYCTASLYITMIDDSDI